MDTLIKCLKQAGDAAARQRAIDLALASGAKTELEGADLAGVDLSGLRLAGVRLTRSNLHGVRAEGAIFPALVQCDAGSIVATRSRFSLVDSCSFRASQLRDTYFRGHVCKCDFESADLTRSIVGNEIPGKCTDNSFRGSDLTEFDAAGTHLCGSSFEGSKLVGARLSRSNLSACNIGGASFIRCNLVHAALGQIDNQPAEVRECLLSPASAIVHINMCGTVYDRVPGL